MPQGGSRPSSYDYDDSFESADYRVPSFLEGVRDEFNAGNVLPQEPTPAAEPEPVPVPIPSPHYHPNSVQGSPEKRRPKVSRRPVSSYFDDASPAAPTKVYHAFNRNSAVPPPSQVTYDNDTSINKRRSLPPSSFLQSESMIRSNSAKDLPLPPQLPEESIMASFRSSSRSTADDSLMKQLGLPTIPLSRQHFECNKLSSKDYDRCEEPWSLQCLAEWISIYYSEEQDMPFTELANALANLFTHKVPTLNWIRAERVAESALHSITSQGFIELSEVNSSLVNLHLDKEASGVIPLLTGDGCYSRKCHTGNVETDGLIGRRCYSSRCSRTLAAKDDKINLTTVEMNADWAAHYNLDDEIVSELEARETKRQFAIHELIVGEEWYVRDLRTLVDVYGKPLAALNPPIIRNQAKFCSDAFDPIPPLIECHSNDLLSELKVRQKQSGPFIDGIADIILGWTKNARKAYVTYADKYPLAARTLSYEKETNAAFASWLEKASKDPRTRGSPHSFYFVRAMPRLARYGLLLGAIKKYTLASDPEYLLLEKAIAECDDITRDCNNRIAEVEKQVEILNLNDQIRFKSPEETVDLKLGDKRRKVLRRGEVTRRGDYRMDWVPTHLILFDHFLVLSKIRKGLGGNQYYVTKKPIPMDLLVFETADAEAVAKSSASKIGVGTFTHSTSPEVVATKRTGAGANPNANADPSSVTVLSEADKEVLYPFKITHLGRNGTSYTLYASSNLDRQHWKDAIIGAKTAYSSAVYAMNAEPFRVKVLTQHAFGYDGASTPKLPVFAPGTAIDRALQESNKEFAGTSPPRPLARSKVNCASSCIFANGQEYIFLGLDYGVYVFTAGSVWQRCIDVPKVTQLEVLETVNAIVLISDRSLVYYNLDAILSNITTTSKPSSATGNAAPTSKAGADTGYRLSKGREVSYFSTGYMKGRLLLFYRRKDGTSSTFKVLEPVKEKGSQKRRSKMTFTRGASLGSTEYFRELDKFYIPSDTYGMSMFKVSFAVHSAHGFEAMSLDYKHPRTIPVQASITSTVCSTLSKGSHGKKTFSPSSVAKKIEAAKPVGMFRCSDKGLILCYEEFAVYCDSHGNLTGPALIEFVCKARKVAFQAPYLLVFDHEMVEVRRIDRSGELKQVLSGKDIRPVDTREGQLKIAMAHPERSGRQLIAELVNNEFVVEDDNSSLAGL